jgi:hypothetical protein
MIRKELLKELIVSFQSSLPKELISRDIELPVPVRLSNYEESGEAGNLSLGVFYRNVRNVLKNAIKIIH